LTTNLKAKSPNLARFGLCDYRMPTISVPSFVSPFRITQRVSRAKNSSSDLLYWRNGGECNLKFAIKRLNSACDHRQSDQALGLHIERYRFRFLSASRALDSHLYSAGAFLYSYERTL